MSFDSLLFKKCKEDCEMPAYINRNESKEADFYYMTQTIVEY